MNYEIEASAKDFYDLELSEAKRLFVLAFGDQGEEELPAAGVLLNSIRDILGDDHGFSPNWDHPEPITWGRAAGGSRLNWVVWQGPQYWIVN